MHDFPAEKLQASRIFRRDLQLQCTMNIPRQRSSFQVGKVRSHKAFHTAPSSRTHTYTPFDSCQKLILHRVGGKRWQTYRSQAKNPVKTFALRLAPDRQQALANKRNILSTRLRLRLFVKTCQICGRRFIKNIFLRAGRCPSTNIE